MNKPINQHWVLRFYLRYFSTPETRKTEDPKAFVHERESLADSPRFESTKEVCALPYLYTPVQLDGERDWLLEKKTFQNLETQLGKVWPRIHNQGGASVGDLSEDERKRIARLIASMHLRNPEIRSRIGRIIEIADRLYGKDRLAQGNRPNGAHPDADNPDRFFVSTIRAHLTKIAETFAAKQWTFVAREADSFVTSDTPVAIINPRDPKKRGPGVPGAITVFPISSRRVLLMRDPASAPIEVPSPATDEWVVAINRSILATSQRMVISSHVRPLGVSTAGG